MQIVTVQWSISKDDNFFLSKVLFVTFRMTSLYTQFIGLIGSIPLPRGRNIGLTKTGGVTGNCPWPIPNGCCGNTEITK